MKGWGWQVILWAVVCGPALFISAGYHDEHGWTPFIVVMVASLLLASGIPGLFRDECGPDCECKQTRPEVKVEHW